MTASAEFNSWYAIIPVHDRYLSACAMNRTIFTGPYSSALASKSLGCKSCGSPETKKRDDFVG